MIIAGPKILLLLPIWLMGLFTYKISQSLTLSNIQGCILALCPILIYIIIRETGLQKFLLTLTIDTLGKDFTHNQLRLSRWFISDYIVGLLVSMHLIGIIALSTSFQFTPILEKTIRYLAGMTFTIYLFHYPLLQFLGIHIDNGVILVTSVFLLLTLIAPLTEGKRQQWDNIIKNIFRLVKKISVK